LSNGHRADSGKWVWLAFTLRLLAAPLNCCNATYRFDIYSVYLLIGGSLDCVSFIGCGAS
jgi:hypothetical protein